VGVTSPIQYEPDLHRFTMSTEAGDAYVTFRWDGDMMVLPHAEVPSALRGTGAGARLAKGVFTEIETMGIKARLTCSFLVRVAHSDPRWKALFGL
jgi:predicted GNAT family acetyltransferase